jgi:hypothetical protein
MFRLLACHKTGTLATAFFVLACDTTAGFLSLNFERYAWYFFATKIGLDGWARLVVLSTDAL